MSEGQERKRVAAILSHAGLRSRSGEVGYPCDDVLTELFYLLLRQGCPAGAVEEIIQELERDLERSREPLRRRPRADDRIEYTNGWLATYAHDLAERLRKVQDMRGKR